MRAIRGLGYGALTGMGAGIVAGLAIALLIAVSIFFSPDNDAATVAAAGGVLLVALLGSVIGGIVGAIAGAALGLVYGATGGERYARWITPGLLLLALGALYGNEFDQTIGYGDRLAILTFFASFALLGFAAGVAFEKKTIESGGQPTDPPPPVHRQLQVTQ